MLVKSTSVKKAERFKAAPEVRVSKPAPRVRDSKSGTEFYIQAQGGLVDQHELANSEGQGAVGLGVGMLFSNRWSIEGNFLFSNHQSSHSYCLVSNSNCSAGTAPDAVRTSSVDTYSFALLGRYDFDFWRRIRPGVGVAASYTFRQHFANEASDVRESSAGDMGPFLGVDVVITDSFRIGAQWRYMMNLTFESEAPDNSTSNLVEVPVKSGTDLSVLEETAYQVWLLSAKYIF